VNESVSRVAVAETEGRSGTKNKGKIRVGSSYRARAK
jgi:hypothetical protein